MARNKMKRFLAGLCTAAMLLQTAGETGMAVMAADNEEVVTTVVSEDDAEEEDPVSADEAEESVSEDAVSENEADTGSVSSDEADDDEQVSENAVISEKESEPEEEPDPDIEEQEDVHDRLIIGSNVYDDVNNNGVADPGEALLGTFNASTGAFVVDANLEYVPSFVFRQWPELKSLSFAPGAKAANLGNNTANNGNAGGAFFGCASLEEVDLSNANDLTKIWLHAFRDCTSLKKVTFNEGLQYIEDYAFYNCALTEVAFGGSLITIGANAFQNNKNLSNVVLKSATTKCGQNIFNGCAIESFTLAKDDKGIVVFPDNLFYNATFKDGAIIDIGADTVEISQNAFRESNIQHVKFSSKLKAINANAFFNCKKLVEIDFTPCKDSLVTLGDSAFEQCIAVTKLDLPDNITRIGKQAFRNCTKLQQVKLPDSTKTKDSLGSYIFDGCILLEKIVFPEGYEYVGEYMFQKCLGLKDITFSSTITEIGQGAFKQCVSLTEVVLPTNAAFTRIPNSCFQECSSLQVCDIREGITEVGSSAFYICNRYMSALPDSLVRIEDNAFNSCGFCGTLTIPKNVAYIGGGAFKLNRDHWGVRGRQELNTVVITPMDIATCGKEIFNGCTLREIKMQDGATRIPANLFNKATWINDKEIEIPAEVVEIGDYAFAGSNNTDTTAGNLVRIVFPDNSRLRIIGREAFAYNAILETFTLPKSVTYIGEKAFSKCAKINSIEIPENVATLGASAFEGCTLLENVTFSAIAVTKSGKNIFKDCSLKNIVIGTKITILPDYLFDGARFQKNSQGQYDMITLTLPASVTRIGIASLTNVVNLKELKFASGSALNEIAMSAFSGCTGLEKIDIPETVTKIDNNAFLNCTSLTGINLPKNLTLLGMSAFKNCPKITTVTIPAGVTDVKKEAFCDCTALAEVKFVSGSLATIQDSAFKNCKLTSIAVPEGVKTIGTYAFAGNVNLATVSLPKTLTQLANYAFADCPVAGTIKLYEGFNNLGGEAFYAAGKTAKAAFYLPETLRSIGKDAFNIAYKDNLSFYVVPGSYAEKWLKDNGFGDRIVGSSEAPKTYTVTFDLQGHGTAIPEVIVEKGNKVTKPADPSEDGWIFGGWFNEKTCKTTFDFETEITKNVTIYAKWDKGAEDIKGGYSALDPVPEITAATTDLWLVKGQKFNIGEGWKVDKAFKKYVSISKKGSFKAKKETPDTVNVIISHEGRNDITVHICKPVIDKKLSLVIETADQVKSGKINLAKDANIKNVLWYSASPDVATVDKDGNVTAVAKGTAKVTAYVNGSAYTCSVTVKETVPALKRTMHINSGASKTIKIKGVKGTWTSANDGIATVNKKGKVSAVAPGKTTLTTNVNGTDYTIDVYVEDINVSGEGVVAGKPNKYTINLKKGEGTTLKFSDSLEQDVVFKSSKPDIAFVDENGKVVARSKGSSSLTTKINGKKVTITVKVTE
ncbi:MAG: leucine-rich repeat protein [Lachnospiraceae bacterium]|nr:leucine-rich repeat protein [Lachnospiraceae bacterium]